MNNITSPRTCEAGIEAEIQEKGLTAPRLTPADIDATIVAVDYVIIFDVVTICCLKLKNGFTVTGESACASKENFDRALGQKIAYTNAREKIWALEGYLLKERMHKGAV